MVAQAWMQGQQVEGIVDLVDEPFGRRSIGSGYV